MKRKPAVSVGVVGLGMFGIEHVRAFARSRRCTVRWVATRNEARLAEVAAQFSVPRASTDWGDLLADPDLSAIAVCTPPHTHYAFGRAVLAAGKHLLLEKPLCISSAEAKRLVDYARRRPGLVFSGCTGRYTRLGPKYAAIQALLSSGQIGKIYLVHHRSVARRSRPGIEYNPTAKWFLSGRLAGGGPFMDLGCYDLAFHLGLLGDPALRTVSAVCRTGLDTIDPGAPVFDVEEHGAAWLTFAGKVAYYWERASNAHGEAPHQTTLYGTRGGVRLGYFPWDPPEFEVFGVTEGGKGELRREVRSVPPGSNDMDALVEAFLAAIVEGRPLPVPPDREARNLAIIERVYAAAGWRTP
jgi:predicted dehydrogenase